MSPQEVADIKRRALGITTPWARTVLQLVEEIERLQVTLVGADTAVNYWRNKAQEFKERSRHLLEHLHGCGEQVKTMIQEEDEK